MSSTDFDHVDPDSGYFEALRSFAGGSGGEQELSAIHEGILVQSP
jgi:hypothetical protein